MANSLDSARAGLGCAVARVAGSAERTASEKALARRVVLMSGGEGSDSLYPRSARRACTKRKPSAGAGQKLAGRLAEQRLTVANQVRVVGKSCRGGDPAPRRGRPTETALESEMQPSYAEEPSKPEAKV